MGDGEGKNTKKTGAAGSGLSRGRGKGGYKALNDGQKLPRSVKVGPGGGRSKGKVCQLKITIKKFQNSRCSIFVS